MDTPPDGTSPTAVTLRELPAVRTRRNGEAPGAERRSEIPVLAVPGDVLRGSRLDHKAGFIVSLLDGKTDLDTLLDLCGMSHGEALAVLDELVADGLVTFQKGLD